MGDKLLPCPFCGANPHHGLMKVEHCQLHGEPFQQFRIWCPHGCAEKTHPNKDWAVSNWNTRHVASHTSALAERDARIAELEATLDALSKEADSFYCQSLNQFSKTECLGWEVKVRKGIFGETEFKAHGKANELMGKHQGMAIAVRRMRAVLAKDKADA